MAKIVLGVALSSISGSVEGTTFARNRGGSYMRNKTVPTQPQTSAVQTRRAILSGLAASWAQTLTDDQRAGWSEYSRQVTLPDSLGQQRNAGGLGMFVRGNSLLVLAGAAPVLDAPSLMEVGPVISNFTVAPSVATADVTIAAFGPALPITDLVLFFAGPPINPGRNFFKGPYNFIGANTVDTANAAYAVIKPLVLALDMFVRAVIVTADARVGTSKTVRATIAA